MRKSMSSNWTPYRSSSLSLAVRTWRKGGKIYLLAVNRTREDLKGTATLGEDFANAKPIMGQGFTKADGRVLSFALNPIDLTMLEIEAKL